MKKSLLFIIPSLFIFFACKQNPLDVDVSDVETTPLKEFRFENDLFSINHQNFETKSAELKSKYGLFYEHYLMNPLKINGSSDTLYKPALLSFVSDRDIKEAYTYVSNIYPESKIKGLMPPLEECVKRFKYHFPQKKLPLKFITCTTGWNYNFAYIDSALVISLDMYLGDTAKFYNMLRYPQYQTRKMNEHHLLPDIARGWLFTEFDNVAAGSTLLDQTIFYGKIYYAVKALLPETADSLIIGYTSLQMKYCKEYEKNLWGYFAEKNRLYDNSLNTLRELVMPLDGPFTGVISKECPPRIAMWVGWQIVRSYMKNNKDVTLQQLMGDHDAQKILNKSKYRP
jgi:hypothetical protein